MASHHINTSWFNAVLHDRGMSQRELCRQLGLDQSAMSLTFRGKRQMKMGEAADIARLLGVALTDVMENAGIQTDATGIRVAPVVGYIDGEGEAHIDWDSKREKLPMPDSLPPDATAMVVKAQTGPLALLDGWTLFIDKPTQPTADLVGRYCVTEIKGGVTVLRFVRRGYKPGTFNLTSLATVGAENVKLDWAAPVLLIKP